ncbi:MAG: hypothetical protein FWH14_04110 [Oscillospiraceae bacterium]|nr:hypothetical protein [Oscillospiraceae bacterium]
MMGKKLLSIVLALLVFAAVANVFAGCSETDNLTLETTDTDGENSDDSEKKAMPGAMAPSRSTRATRPPSQTSRTTRTSLIPEIRTASSRPPRTSNERVSQEGKPLNDSLRANSLPPGTDPLTGTILDRADPLGDTITTNVLESIVKVASVYGQLNYEKTFVIVTDIPAEEDMMRSFLNGCAEDIVNGRPLTTFITTGSSYFRFSPDPITFSLDAAAYRTVQEAGTAAAKLLQSRLEDKSINPLMGVAHSNGNIFVVGMIVV